jgi:GNAT superfamily N-acetyltransferase
LSLFGKYILERQNKQIIENEFGFATYYFENVHCYIEDIYVVPEKRKSDIAKTFADEITQIAKDKNCKWLIGSVKPSANGSTASLKVLLAYGFQLHKCFDDFIWFRKDLEE